MSAIYRKYFPEAPDEIHEKLDRLQPLYLDWNEKINVISRKDTSTFAVNHVLHSLGIVRVFNFKAGTEILDFGTGGGFPGIPLAVFFPEVQFTLVDSIGKKMKVVQRVADELDLQNVRVVNERVENLKEKFDFVTCRAVGRIGKIMPWVMKSLKSRHINDMPNGYIFLKGGDLTEELKESTLPFRRYALADYFDEEFFRTKEIVYLSKDLKSTKQRP